MSTTSRGRTRRLSYVRPHGLVATLLALALLPLAGAAPALAQQDERCFAETGYCISGRIREYWAQNGGAPIFGYPIGPQLEARVEGGPVQTQWFERVRMELHPENQPPYDVLLGRIGVEALEQQGRDWTSFPRSEASAECQYFPETGHNVCGAILQAWEANGLAFDNQPGSTPAESLALFGLPLSDEMTETVEGQQYTVQWFERARFELHPENQAPYNVLFGRLGAELRGQRGPYVLPGDAVFPEGVAFRESSGDFFVSSTGDGTIFRGNIGRAAVEVFSPGGADGRSAATGMKVDDSRGRLFVSGGGTGGMYVYSLSDGSLLGKFQTARTPTFINDVALVPGGDAFFTDSQSPVIYRVYSDESGALAFEEWLDLSGTPITYQQGFNLNGIDASADGRYLVTVQSNTGKLFRIDVASKQVSEIALNGEALTNGDGLLLNGGALYVVRNQQGVIVKLNVDSDLTSASAETSVSNSSLAYPTTIALAKDRLLVVNSQFDRRGEGMSPDLPFTIASIPVP